MTKVQKLTVIPALAVTMLIGGAIAGYAGLAAAQTNAGSTNTFFRDAMHKGPGVHGTISSISGSTLTIAGKNGTTYTVDASSAEVKKFTEGQEPVTQSLSDLAAGEEVGVHGTVSGTSVTAEVVMEGVPPFGKFMHMKGHGIGGTVTAVSGSSVTLTGPDGQSYTVDASNAAIQKMVSGSLSDIAVGDHLGVQGTVSGNTVTATMIMDGLPKPSVQ